MMRNYNRPYTAPRYYSEDDVQPLITELRRLKAQAIQQEEIYQQRLAVADAELKRWRSHAAALESAQSKSSGRFEEQEQELSLLRRRNAELETSQQRVPIDQSDFLAEILPFVDNLERALQAENSDSPLRQGIAMTIEAFQKTLAKIGVEPIHVQGQAFDPHFHEAVMAVEDPAQAAGTIAGVEQTGYTYGDRLLRPARVRVVAG
jgi:molecular chaperone GrpE